MTVLDIESDLALAGALAGTNYLVVTQGSDIPKRVTLATHATFVATTLQLENDIYTPTVTAVTNVDSTTPNQCSYTRHGDMVHVFGSINVDPTTASVATEVGISLPIASAIVSQTNLVGSAHNIAGTVHGAVSGDITNDRASLQYLPALASVHAVLIHFSYRIL